MKNKNKLFKHPKGTVMKLHNKKVIVFKKDDDFYLRFKRIANKDMIDSKEQLCSTVYYRNMATTTLAISKESLIALYIVIEQEIKKDLLK